MIPSESSTAPVSPSRPWASHRTRPTSRSGPRGLQECSPAGVSASSRSPVPRQSINAIPVSPANHHFSLHFQQSCSLPFQALGETRTRRSRPGSSMAPIGCLTTEAMPSVLLGLPLRLGRGPMPLRELRALKQLPHTGRLPSATKWAIPPHDLADAGRLPRAGFLIRCPRGHVVSTNNRSPSVDRAVQALSRSELRVPFSVLQGIWSRRTRLRDRPRVSS